MAEQLTIALDKIKENPVALRSVNKTSESYLQNVDSVRTEGVIIPVVVRLQKDKETGKATGMYELVDGLHRVSWARDAGLAEIPVIIRDYDDYECLIVQTMANIHRVETKPCEYSNQLKRILMAKPLMTEAELATKLSRSPQWIAERLGLTKIVNPEVKQLIDGGKIGLTNAYALAKLPEDEVPNFIQEAMTMAPEEFVPKVTARVKELKEASRKGQDAQPRTFQPVAYIQKVGDIKAEIENPKIIPALIQIAGVTTAADGAKIALQWLMHLDSESIKVQKAEFDAKVAKEAEEKKKRDIARAERAKKTAEEAAAKAAKAAEAAKEAAK